MRKFFRTFFLCSLLTITLTAYAHAEEDTLKVGLYYGSGALFSANLQNAEGSGYALGWFDETDRKFHELGWLEEEKISMTADGAVYIKDGVYYAGRQSGAEAVIGGYRVELDETFDSFEEAAYVAEQFDGGYPAYVNNAFVVRLGAFLTREEAEVAAATYSTYTWYDERGREHSFWGIAVSPSVTGVIVTVTGSDRILFAFDCSGAKSLGILPDGGREGALTWFKGYRWYGGFEYRRATGGNINVINVVDIDDYVKGVLPYEMSPEWPLEALKAQAVCARTYALIQTKHYSSYKFDVCNTTDCQVYQGANLASGLTDRAAEETAGVVAVYDGEYAELYYCSSNGGASESSENVWTTALPYLTGKTDPFEDAAAIPGYSYTVSYTYEQLTKVLQSKGYDIGRVAGAYISETTDVGNVREITFTDVSGKTLRVTGETCRTIFYTTLFGETKSVKSMRFTISGGGSGGYCLGNGSAVQSLEGLYTISGTGLLDVIAGEELYVASADGTAPLSQPEGAAGADGITITGTGSGHNVGMSQYGAKAMAEAGYSYEDILDFYFTGITLERIG